MEKATLIVNTAFGISCSNCFREELIVRVNQELDNLDNSLSNEKKVDLIIKSLSKDCLAKFPKEIIKSAKAIMLKHI